MSPDICKMKVPHAHHAHKAKKIPDGSTPFSHSRLVKSVTTLDIQGRTLVLLQPGLDICAAAAPWHDVTGPPTVAPTLAHAGAKWATDEKRLGSHGLSFTKTLDDSADFDPDFSRMTTPIAKWRLASRSFRLKVPEHIVHDTSMFTMSRVNPVRTTDIVTIFQTERSDEGLHFAEVFYNPVYYFNKMWLPWKQAGFDYTTRPLTFSHEDATTETGYMRELNNKIINLTPINNDHKWVDIFSKMNIHLAHDTNLHMPSYWKPNNDSSNKRFYEFDSFFDTSLDCVLLQLHTHIEPVQHTAPTPEPVILSKKRKVVGDVGKRAVEDYYAQNMLIECVSHYEVMYRDSSDLAGLHTKSRLRAHHSDNKSTVPGPMVVDAESTLTTPDNKRSPDNPPPDRPQKQKKGAVETIAKDLQSVFTGAIRAVHPHVRNIPP